CRPPLWMRASGVPTVEPSLRFVKSAGHLRRTNRSSARRLLPILSKHQGARARGRRGGLAMRLLCLLFLLALGAGIAVFVMQNENLVTLTLFNQPVTAPLVTVVAVAY